VESEKLCVSLSLLWGHRLGSPHLGEGLVVVSSEHNSETLVLLEAGYSLDYA